MADLGGRLPLKQGPFDYLECPRLARAGARPLAPETEQHEGPRTSRKLAVNFVTFQLIGFANPNCKSNHNSICTYSNQEIAN